MQIKFQTRQTTILFILKQMYVTLACSKYDIVESTLKQLQLMVQALTFFFLEFL